VIFSLFGNDRLASTFRWSEDPSTAWLLPSTAEDPPCRNRFLQAGKEVENTKEKSRRCLTGSLKGLRENGGWSLSLTSAIFQEGFALKYKKPKTKNKKNEKPCNVLCNF
jgi:hypothetical protein